jgi:hypothetical protein
MKKFLFVLLAAALALPMMAQNPKDAALNAKAQQYRFATKVIPQTSLQPQHFDFKASFKDEEVPEGMVRVTLAAGDVWQDGSGYQMLLDADANAFGTIIPETGPLSDSGNVSDATYAEFEYKIPENADGNLSTANIVLDDAISILIPAGVYDWCITNPTPGDRMWIASNQGNVGGRADDYEFIGGCTYIFTVSIGGQNDQTNVEIIDPLAPVMPENVTVNPAATTADVAWENDHDQEFNLRYREYNPNVAQNVIWDFETEETLEGWMIYDADGDGDNWYWNTSCDLAHSGTSVLASDSYYWGALYPDNWLISPEIDINGTLSFWASGYSSSWYDEVFRVYVAPADWESVDEFIPISDDITTEYGMNEYTFDLSQCDLAGEKGVFAIRHYNCSDVFTLYVDDVCLTIPGDEPNEWIVVEGIEGNEYTIEGLTPETTYEVQVQAVGEDRRVSDWTESTLFTTLEGGEEPPVVEEGIFIVLIDQEGNEVQYTLNPSANNPNNYVTMVTLEYNPWGAYDPNYDERPNVPFYFLVNGQRLGAEVDMTPVLYGEVEHTLQNPLFENENCYTVPVGYTYTIGIQFNADGTMYVLCAQGPRVGVDELNADKAVAGVRYFNTLGQEMQQAEGLTIVVTTYTDGTTSAVKVVK